MVCPLPAADVLLQKGHVSLGHQCVYPGLTHSDSVYESLSGIMTKRADSFSVGSLRYEQKIFPLFKDSSLLPGKICYTKPTEREQ